MTFADLRNLQLPAGWLANAQNLTTQLQAKTTLADKKAFINAKRASTWGDSQLVIAFKSDSLLGNKCWYTEAPIVGADHNLDHFRPKSRVTEVDEISKAKIGEIDGYWWLAFEYQNYRLSSQHANQIRNDSVSNTTGGKSDFFPVSGPRCAINTAWNMIQEEGLLLDPCSPTDVALLRFNPDGQPIVRKNRNEVTDPLEERKVNISIWIYHLKKSELVKARKDKMEEVKREFDDADRNYRLWQSGSASSKQNFDVNIAKIKDHIKDNAAYAGAARSMKLLMISQYEWVDDYCSV